MRWTARVGWLAVCSLSVMAACVLSSPPSDLPIPAPTRPAIADTSADPPLDQPVTMIPHSFAIYVEAEQYKDLNWSVWFDYGGDQLLVKTSVEPRGMDRRTINFDIQDIPFPNQCHKIWLFVAYDFLSVQPLPANDQEDHAVWLYQPGGQYAGCPIFDSGIPDANVRDTSDGALD